MVNPVPDSTTTDIVRTLNSLPVVGQATASVPHRVGIFGDVEGVLDVVLPGSSSFNPRNGGILIGAHIYDVVVALVLHWARSVHTLRGLIALNEVHPWARLVAKRPDDDTRVIDVCVHHLEHTRDVLRLKLGNVR